MASAIEQKAGLKSELGSLYQEHQGFVRTCLRRFRVPEQGLEDAVQDVFVAMLGRAAQSYQRARQVRPWLFGISRNVANNARRRVARRSRIDGERASVAPVRLTPEEVLAKREAALLLAEFLQRLDPKKLAPFILVEVEGQTARQAAEALELPVTTVRWRVRSARAELERLASGRSPRSLPAILVWLWPWRSARLLPQVIWSGGLVAMLVMAWRSNAPRPPTPATSEGSRELTAAASGPLQLGPATAPSPSPGPAMASGAATISGRVKTPAGEPISGARVCEMVDERSRTSVTDLDPVCTRSASDGSYRLTEVRPGVHRVGASAAGYLPSEYAGSRGTGRLIAGPRQLHREIDIVLRGGGVAIRGVVVDQTGGVVAAATVRGQGFRRFVQGWLATASTDDEGRFELWVPPGPVSVDARADGYAVRRGVDANAPQDDVEIQIMPGASLTGLVVDPGGDAVAGMRVCGNRDRHNAPERFVCSTTDGRGRFELGRLQAGEYRPIARGPGRYGEAEDPVLVAFGQPSPSVRIVAEPAVPMEVAIEAPVVLDGCDGGSVMVAGATHHEARVVDGVAVFEGIPPGPYQVLSSCRGQRGRAETDVALPGPHALTLSFDPPATVRGVVWDLTGPVAFARLLASPAGSKQEGPIVPEGTVMGGALADGSFVMAVPPGEYDLIASTRTGGHLPLATVEVDDGEHRDLGELRFPAVGSIDGRVVDVDGRATGGLQIDVVKTPGLGARSRADGTFALLDLVPGRYRLRAKRGALELGDEVEVTVEADGSVAATIRVPRLDGQLHGQVRGPGGEPVADARVWVHEAGAEDPRFRRVASAPTDAEGGFEVRGLPPGSYGLTVRGASVPGETGGVCRGAASGRADAEASKIWVLECR